VHKRRGDQPQSVFGIAVEYVSRGRVPTGDYCGAGSHASVKFSIYSADRGVIHGGQEMTLEPAPCNVRLDDDAYYRRILF
jgi:hypothetical protein